MGRGQTDPPKDFLLRFILEGRKEANKQGETQSLTAAFKFVWVFHGGVLYSKNMHGKLKGHQTSQGKWFRELTHVLFMPVPGQVVSPNKQTNLKTKASL